MLIKEREQVDELRSEHAKVDQMFVELKNTLATFLRDSEGSAGNQEE